MANSEKLEEYRKATGKTKTFLARRLNISRPSLYKIFKNPSNATFSQTEAICSELGIRLKSEKDDIFLP